MENTPTFKQLKITETNGLIKYVPFNRANKQHYSEYKNWLSKEKQTKFKVEEVELTLDEAVAIGLSEAIQTKFPPKRAKQNDSSDLVKLLADQIAANKEKDNMLADLAARLSALESKPKK